MYKNLSELLSLIGTDGVLGLVAIIIILSYLKKLSLILILLSSSIYVSSEAWVVEDIRISGLQRISAGSIFSNIPVTIGDKVDTADIQNISKSILGGAAYGSRYRALKDIGDKVAYDTVQILYTHK